MQKTFGNMDSPDIFSTFVKQRRERWETMKVVAWKAQRNTEVGLLGQSTMGTALLSWKFYRVNGSFGAVCHGHLAPAYEADNTCMFYFGFI